MSTSAWAAYGVHVTATPSDKTAGAHSDLKIDLTFDEPQRDIKDMVLHLPAGLLGDPHAADLCSVATFQSATGCPASSQVGTVASTARVAGLASLGVSGGVFNLQPQGGEPALLGIQLSDALGLAAPIKLLSPVSARAPGGDYGLDSTVRNIPNMAQGLGGLLPLPIDVLNMSLTLWGSNTAHPSLKSPFLVNPTTCTPGQVTADVTAYDGSKASDSAQFTPTGCDTIPFQPKVSMSPTTFRGDQPAGVAAQVAFDGDIGGRAQSHLRSARVVLPPGFVLSAGVAADGLEGCTDAQFGLKENRDPSCPALSKIGDVSFVSPLLGELTGDVFLGMPTAQAPMRLLAYARKGDVRVKLVGVTRPDPNTGQLTTIFDDLPQQPFRTFTLTFRGGDTAVLTTPQTCGTGTVTAAFEPFARPGTTASAESAPVTTSDCPAPAFGPSAAVTLTPTQAGADSKVSVAITRPDGQARLSSLSMAMPPGLLGHLASVPACPIDSARAGNCDESSRVGTAVTSAGTGPRTVELSGPIYLTTAFDGGVGGLAVVINAKVGPLDLGKVVSITRLALRPPELGIQADTEPLPQILGGVPLAIRGLTLSLDRDGFMLNPTSCAPLSLNATFTGVGGASASASAPVQATGCENLPFAPKVAAAIGAPLANPSLKVTVQTPAGNANMRSLQMALPKEVGANLAALSKGCTAAQFEANACPASSVIGDAVADSPLSPAPLTGPVRLVQTPGQTLPDLVIDLSGFTNLQLRIKNQFPNGRLVSSIDGLPDVPLSQFVLNLKGGALLQTVDVDKICSAKPTVDATFNAQSGATAKVTAVASLPACTGGASSAALRTSVSLTGAGKGRTPSLRVKVSGTKLRSLRVTLPKALKLNAKALRKGGRSLAGGKTIKRKTALPHTRTSVTASSSKATGSLELRLGKGALRKGSGLKVGKRLSLKLRVVDSSGKARNLTVRVTPRR